MVTFFIALLLSSFACLSGAWMQQKEGKKEGRKTRDQLCGPGSCQKHFLNVTKHHYRERIIRKCRAAENLDHKSTAHQI